MPKLVLLFEGRVIRETAVTLGAPVTIGRLPDNTIVIDNSAVSSHHVRVAREGPQFFVEDLGSTNGTFVNGEKVSKKPLRHGDTILVGKHKLFFDRMGEAEFDGPELSGGDLADFGGTVMLDPEQQQRLLAAAQARIAARNNAAAAQAAQGAQAAPAAPVAAPPAAEAPAPAPSAPKPRQVVGRLYVVHGQADLSEYRLDGSTSFIGTAESSLIRLHGWFKPKLAVAIARMGESYVATPVAGKTLINGQRLQNRRGLVHGDVLEVSGLELEFRLTA
jgi:predicted component of type VI protein secretion system